MTMLSTTIGANSRLARIELMKRTKSVTWAPIKRKMLPSTQKVMPKILPMRKIPAASAKTPTNTARITVMISEKAMMCFPCIPGRLSELPQKGLLVFGTELHLPVVDFRDRLVEEGVRGFVGRAGLPTTRAIRIQRQPVSLGLFKFLLCEGIS